ncbi:MAG: response regulator transcription factor [Proteobacteria bacterium]|nr:MAG: response regulator transcription factor [Pseudomonadota bacterium]
MGFREEIRIALVDDHAIFRDGLKTLIRRLKRDHYRIVGEAENGKEFLAGSLIDEVDVVLMDLQMPEQDGVSATRELKVIRPEIKVIILSTFDQPQMVLDALKAGADGYLLKNVDKGELAEAIDSVSKGGRYFSRNEHIQNAVAQFRRSKNKADVPVLSEREVQIIKLICREMSNKEIAEELSISKRTVETYRRRIMEKIEAKNLAGVVLYAVRKGWIDRTGSAK